MAMVMDQQHQTFKHYCRICKKGFGCGRALGGHMRAHGINDDSICNNADQEDEPSGCSEWGTEPPNNKRMYALRTNPNRLKNSRFCENCGKEFVSWKSFLEHGKCSSDDYLLSSPTSDGDDDDPLGQRGSASWWKGKRSRRAKSVVAATPLSAICPSTEEEDLANCLMLLSSARACPVYVDEAEESCASASKDEDRRHHWNPSAENSQAPVQAVPKGMFECKACKKVFTSHQALGGHRASHKKVKGCFAAKLDDPDEALPKEDVTPNDNGTQAATASMALAIVPFDNTPLAVMPLKKKSKVHECSICHRQFASGQALGGHKRCHWITSNSGTDPSSMAKLQQMQDPFISRRANQHGLCEVQRQRHELTFGPMFGASETLDLNLPAPAEIGGGRRQDIGSPLRLDVPAALYLQTWVDHKNKSTTGSNNNNDNKNQKIEEGCLVDDEVDSKGKLAKLSELKDINVGAEGSHWLQVGIGSSGNEGRES